MKLAETQRHWQEREQKTQGPDLDGNIVNGVCTGLVGGAGLVPGANYGATYAVFETAAWQSGKNIADKNMASPTGMLLEGCVMLDYFKLHSYATPIHTAVLAPLQNKDVCTLVIRGHSATSDVNNNIVNQLVLSIKWSVPRRLSYFPKSFLPTLYLTLPTLNPPPAWLVWTL